MDKNWHSIKFCCSILVRLSLFVLLLYREDQVEETIHQVSSNHSAIISKYAICNIQHNKSWFSHNFSSQPQSFRSWKPKDVGSMTGKTIWYVSYYITCPIFWNVTSRQAGPPQLDPHIRQHREFMWAAVMHSIQKCWRPCKQVLWKKICRRVYSVRPTIPWSHLRLAPPASSCRRCPLYWGSLQVSF